jgi:hypothetical protein
LVPPWYSVHERTEMLDHVFPATKSLIVYQVQLCKSRKKYSRSSNYTIMAEQYQSDALSKLNHHQSTTRTNIHKLINTRRNKF